MTVALGAIAAVVMLLGAAVAVAAASNEGLSLDLGGADQPEYCRGKSSGGQRTYPFDSDGDGIADVCSLPRTRRAAVARQLAMERLAAASPAIRLAHLPPSAGANRRYYSGTITGPGYCVNLSLGGPVRYPLDSDGDGDADKCAPPRYGPAAAARQQALEELATDLPEQFMRFFALECALGPETYGEPAAEAQDDCRRFRSGAAEPSTSVTSDAPLRVYAAGDSQAQYLTSWLKTDDRLELAVDAFDSTGLARPDVYDWPLRFAEVLSGQDAEMVVLIMGGNDTQALWTVEGAALARYLGDGWHEEWSRRLDSVLDQFAAPHRHLVWVGLPPTRPDHFHRGFAMLNQLAAEVIAARSDTTFLDIWDLFGGDGPYRETLVHPDGGPPETVRHPDGVHLSITGARWVADLVAEIAEGRWRFE